MFELDSVIPPCWRDPSLALGMTEKIALWKIAPRFRSRKSFCRIFVPGADQPLGVRRGERLYNVCHPPNPECLRGEGPRNRTMDVQTGLYNPRLFVRSMTSAEGRDSSRPGRAEARPSKPITIRPCPHHLNSGATISYKISMQSP